MPAASRLADPVRHKHHAELTSIEGPTRFTTVAVPPQRFGSFSLRRFSFSLSAPFSLELHGLDTYIDLGDTTEERG